MEPAATIRQLRLDVHTASLVLGRELPERLSQLFHGPLLAVLTAELSRVAGPPRRLAELVLVLPPIAAGRLAEDLPAALRLALRHALADLNASEAAGMPEGAEEPWAENEPQTRAVTLAEDAEPLAGLRHFLLTGRLPWQVNGPGFDLDAAVARAGRQHPRALLALLRQVGPQPWPRQRLARQLAPATLDQLIGLLAPADAPLVRAYLHDTLAAHRRRPLPAATPALRQVLHELVLADLLAHWHTQFNRRAFVARQLRQLAAHYNIDLAALLRQLVAALPLAGPPQPQSPTLPGLVHELHHQLARQVAPAGQPAAKAEPAAGAPDASHSPATPSTPATSDAAATPNTLADPAPLAAAAALAYYLRHGSLPPVSGDSLPQATLAAEAARALGLGRRALLVLAQQAGPAATANGLLALLPSAQHAELVRRLAPGHTRPVLALLDELARPAAAAARRQLWQQAVAQLLATPPEMALPALRRWLPLQVPALLAAEASHGAARAQLFHYLLAGLAPLPGVGVPSPAQLRRTLRELLTTRDRSLPDFLSEYRGRPLVLRHLAALAGAVLLTQLVPGPTRPRPRHAATQRALAALLGEPAGLAAGASGAARQQLLREAYLLFHLRGPGGARAGSTDRLRQLSQAYALPTQALRGYLRHQVQQWPVLASSGFFKWLVAGLSAEGSPQARQSATTSPTPLTANAPYSATENVAAPTRQIEARLGFQAAASYSATKFDLAGKNSTQPSASSKELMARGRLFGRLNYAAVLRGATARGATTQAASADLPAPATGDRSSQAAPQLNPAAPVPTTESQFGQGAEVDPDTGIEQRATTGPAAAPAPQLVEALGLHLAWPATTAEALRTLAFYHPARRNWRGELRSLLHWLAAREPTPVAAWLSAHLLAAPRWPGPAVLLDFALLGRLLAGARAARPALAALEMQASQELARSPQLLALLRAAALLGHFEPASAGRQLVRLAAAYGLPRRATAARLSQLVHQWPVLATLPGWHLLRAALPTPAPWAAVPPSPSARPKAAKSAKPMTSALSLPPTSAGSVTSGFVPAVRPVPVPLPDDPAPAAPQAGQSPALNQPPRVLPPDTFPVRTHFLAPAISTARAAEDAFSAASLVGQEVGARAPASPDLLFHYLLHGRAPWWHTGPLLPEALGQALRRAAQPPQPLREFLRRHGRQAAVQRHLAALADFSLLHELLPPGAGRSRRQLVRPALAALDRSLRRPAGASQERLRLFLQEAYLAYASSPPTPADPLAAARRQAAASGLAWRTVLARAAALLHQHPALAADPFFAALLHATLARPTPAATRRPQRSAATTQSASVAKDTAAPSNSTTSPAATTTGSPALPRSQPGKAAFSAAAEKAWVVVARYLQAGAAADNPAQLLAGLPPRQAADVLARARPYVGAATGRQRLAALLRPAVAEHLLRQWWPTSYRPLGQVARGWLRLPGLGPDERAGVWAAVLAVALAGGPRPQQLAALLTHLLRAHRAHQPTTQTARQVLQELTRRGQRRAGPLAALLAAHASAPAPGQPPKPASRPAPDAPTSRLAGTGPALAPGTAPGVGRPGSLQLRPEAGEAGPAASAYVANAGLVLLWPFMTMLFERLGYLEQRQFKSPELAERATHLLQFLATGEENFPEYELALNKLLCGVEAARPLARRVPLTPEERSTGEGLLGAVLQRWEVLKNTSVAGLRETFLQRAGRLDYHAERVALTVETKTLDILLDQRPWSISTIKLPWMPLPLYVTWR